MLEWLGGIWVAKTARVEVVGVSAKGVGGKGVVVGRVVGKRARVGVIGNR